jgi:hypothetical protein
VEGGTVVGLGVAGTAFALAAGGVLLCRSTLISWAGAASVVATALITAAFGVMVVAGGTGVYLDAAVPACSTSESDPGPTECLDAGDRGKQAAAAGLLGGLLAGVLGGCVAAWRRSRSVLVVVGGLLAAVGTTVLALETLVVLVLWSA